MTLIVPSATLRDILASLAASAAILRLYTDARDPRLTDEPSDFTEAEFFGYRAIPLEPGRWTFSMVGRSARAIYPEQRFVASRNQVPEFVHGYMVTGDDDGGLLWAERFPNGPYEMAVSGDRIDVMPRITQRNALA
jgi:hypothetical protein